jgi:hypothetical protein
MTAPIASGWSGCRVGLAPTGKRRLCTAHTHFGRQRQTAEKPRFGLVFAECWSLAYNRNCFPEAEIAP